MTWRKFIIAVLVCSGLAAGGCSTLPSSSNMVASTEPLTPQQEAWWTANKNRAIFVPARGYYVEGVGYFDPDGHPMLAKNTGQKESPKPKQDPYEGQLFRTLTGQETPNSTPTPTPVGAGVVASSAGTGATPDPTTPGDEPDKGWGMFSTTSIARSWAKLTGKNKDTKQSQSSFEQAEELFRQAKYAEAVPKFQDAINHWPESAIEEDALFLKAECEFFQDKYPAANDDYAQLLKQYPNSRHLDKAVNRRFAIARYWQQLAEKNPHWPTTPNFFDKERPWFDTAGHALGTYDRIRIEDPTGPLADDAIMASGNAYFVQARYLDADYYYDLLRRDYPRSEHLLNAYKLGLQCKLRKYQGAAYDGTPLVEAEELINQMVKQFPRELADERERLATAKKEIHAQLAARDFNMAKYYDAGSHYGAARYYYASVVKKYPDSSFAQEAQKRMGEIKSEPDNPPDRLEFLARWFNEPNNPNMPSNAAKNAVTPAPQTATATAPTGTTQR